METSIKIVLKLVLNLGDFKPQAEYTLSDLVSDEHRGGETMEIVEVTTEVDEA